MIDEAGAIKELRECMKRAEDLTRQLGYARMDTRWITVNSILASTREKLDQLIVAKRVKPSAIHYRTKDADRA